MKKIINESLFPGDLVNLVSDHISIDEYEAKIDPKAIVLAFFVREEDPAYDLSRFIEFGPVKNILDTEVSPAPDEKGNYLVFIEIEAENKKELAKTIIDVLKVAKHLSEIDVWTYHHKDQSGELTV